MTRSAPLLEALTLDQPVLAASRDEALRGSVPILLVALATACAICAKREGSLCAGSRGSVAFMSSRP